MPVGSTDYAATYNMTAIASTGYGLSGTGMHQADLVTFLTQLETNWNACLAHLDADAGVTLTTYVATYKIDLDDTVVGSKGLSQDKIVSVLDSFVSKFNSCLTALDGDSGVTDTNYNSTLALTDVVNSTTYVVSTAVDNAGMSQEALATLLGNIVTKFNALNAKLDADA
jgi:hypothetical protein